MTTKAEKREAKKRNRSKMMVTNRSIFKIRDIIINKAKIINEKHGKSI